MGSNSVLIFQKMIHDKLSTLLDAAQPEPPYSHEMMQGLAAYLDNFDKSAAEETSRDLYRSKANKPMNPSHFQGT